MMSVFSGSSARALRYAAIAPARSKPSPKRRPTASCCSIQPSVFQASADFGSSLRRGQRLALRARAESGIEQRRRVAQAVHGLARILARPARRWPRSAPLKSPSARSATPTWSNAISCVSAALELAQRRQQRLGLGHRVAALDRVEAPGRMHDAIGGDLNCDVEPRRTELHDVIGRQLARLETRRRLDAVAPLGDERLEHHVGRARVRLVTPRLPRGARRNTRAAAR